MSNVELSNVQHDGARSVRLARAVALAVVASLLFGGAVRLWANVRASQALVAETEERQQQSVSIVRARLGPAEVAVSLPATLRGFEEAVIYARTGGYVSAWRAEIGDRVSQGEVLVTLSAPEQEHELLQARAAREQTSARVGLARATLARWEAQRQRDVVSQQQLDEKRSETAQAEADLAAADANVQRLTDLFALQSVRAPFDGVITRRRVDTGALVTAGQTELFELAHVQRLRITVWVPQAYANDVAAGQRVTVRVNGIRGNFTGAIEHVSGALDAATRTRQVDIVVPNDDGRLLPGAYAEVGLRLGSGTRSLLIPPNALIVNREGTRVMVVDANDRIELKPIVLGRDLGRELEVLEGITAEDRIVTNPADILREGDRVAVRPLPDVSSGDAGS